MPTPTTPPPACSRPRLLPRDSRKRTTRLLRCALLSPRRGSVLPTPHLHTHVVVANVAQGVDGLWSTLDSRRLFRHGPAAQGVYHARLRHELTCRLGVAWHLHPSGMGDVAGVDPTLCRLFSGRSADVDEHVYRRSAARSLDLPASRGIAALVTRPPKDMSRTVDDLAGEWRARAREWGFPPSELTRVVGLGRAGRSPGPGGNRRRSDDSAPPPRSAWTRTV